ncbi:SusC/RagA family TonB-linked outer membrane protein [Sphingobacterium sp. UT-1RO-CII-1]|uniref:SusC/RagA family TonB-linked outer membrane protein n=1 Tax=Sphingobacterium sp. UT-1RO-CII-1 TaxID=2995225 RepID=UPI00227CD0AB|nr:SusC/RagA family TonB-linked outer membrane protein [Sphingobacterium sp. UT-1RO-CII-1]MCY4779261.1 SusC/RagA family TonB-linked outer membrane protein [Sphingobacterium sp. UT-1RO-CII-1]
MMRFLRKGDYYALEKPIKKRCYLSLNSFQCLLLPLGTIYYQFSCNVQESRARGTTGDAFKLKRALTHALHFLKAVYEQQRHMLGTYLTHERHNNHTCLTHEPHMNGTTKCVEKGEKSKNQAVMKPSWSMASVMSFNTLLIHCYYFTHTWRILRPYTKSASARVAGVFGMASRLGRTLVDICSTGVRLLFECCSSAVRVRVEAQSKASRRASEGLSNKCRSRLEAQSKDCRRALEGLSNKCRTRLEELVNRPPRFTCNDGKVVNDLYMNRLILRWFESFCEGVRGKVESMLVKSKRSSQNSLNEADGFLLDKERADDIKRPMVYGLQLIAIFCVLFSSLVYTQAAAQTQTELVLRGEVRSAADGQAIEGATVSVAKRNAYTDKEGKFSIRVNNTSGIIAVKHIGYSEQKVTYENINAFLKISLQTSERQIEEVEVISTGFQAIPKERATGSFEFVDNKLFNRKVSTDFVSRLEDVVPSISSIKTSSSNRGNVMNLHIRGQSTLRSERWPLVVIDGIPYVNRFGEYGKGMFNNINPNDIENITVLKDAAASSIWGAQSGNGVIVITTKRAKYNQPFQLSFNSSLTVGEKPDLYYYPQMSSADHIEAERFLFDNGYWDSRMYDFDENLSPVIQLLKKHKEGGVSDVDMEAEFERLRSIDVRDDFLKHVYRNSTKQQYNLQLLGGSEKINTQLSIGYDKNLNSLVTSSYERFTVKNNTQLRPLKNLSLDLGITYTEAKTRDATTSGVEYMRLYRNYPYLELADEAGRPLVVDATHYSPEFRDTAAGGRLLDWKYRPLEELYEDYEKTHLREVFLNFQTAYQLSPSLAVKALYAYQHSTNPIELWYGLGSIFQRSLINSHASWTDNEVIWGLPVGDYLNTISRYNKSHQGRLQLDYTKSWKAKHELNAIAGAEIRQVGNNLIGAAFWGYDPQNLSFKSLEFGKPIPVFNGMGGSVYLDDHAQLEGYTNRYISYYANGSYTYDKRYILSASARQDASNLFGVKTNDKFQPFWSVGGAWLLSNESFINEQVFPLLKLRATYGYNGNVNNSTAAFPIINVQSAPHSVTGNSYAQMQAPPNPSLRWERVGMFNMGLDFNVKNRFSGALEYYIKKPKDLIATSTIDPSTGYSTLMVNAADLDGRGVDLSLQSLNIQTKDFNWISNLVFAYHTMKVTKAYNLNLRSDTYRSGNFGTIMTPIKGYDLYSLLTYKWAGLDAETGMPQGYLDGEVSDDYFALVYNSQVEDMDNHGSSRPRFFGSLRNSISYKNFDLSFNISYQLGYKFVRSSFDNRYFKQSGLQHKDFGNRWQKPGDEKYTDVPSFIYSNNVAAADLYYYSSALVERGDQIKLRDIQLSYTMKQLEKVGLKNARIYAYIQNIGTLWRANEKGIDPEYGENIPDPRYTSFGVNFNL